MVGESLSVVVVTARISPSVLEFFPEGVRPMLLRVADITVDELALQNGWLNQAKRVVDFCQFRHQFPFGCRTYRGRKFHCYGVGCFIPLEAQQFRFAGEYLQLLLGVGLFITGGWVRLA